jgi:signal transduction histidine kinase
MRAMRAAIEARATDLDTSNRRLSEEIADHRRTSEALYQVQKMEALGNLTGGFAHDFNNILMVIIAHLEMIAKGRSPAATAELAYKAIGAAQSGADLTARMLAFARQQTLTPHPTELVAVVREFQQFVTHAVSGNIVVDYDIAVPAATSNIDAAQFQSVLLNLVVNARDAMPDGGGITISVARTRLDAGDLRGTGSAPGDFIAVSVADNGEGMSAQTLERAFEPFFTTKAATGGTGLGLPQVYGFARQSGGVARIESSPGQGTRVTIFIPEIAPDERAQSPSPAASQRPIRRACSVLLVDDNVAVLQAVEQGLIDEGWTVQPVDNAASALDAVASGTAFDIVVTDIDMPGSIGGLRLAKQLTGRFPVPVLLISGAPISAEVYDSGFPLIVKPFRKAELVERIQAIVEAREAARAPGLPREP